ncbi:hypothetical protein QYM36_006742 [Artemia franciscana]|uniref:Kinesin motor domain-containing protein n=1 Tax=Artemia franciscana TaxID=6661 RepID=A0AA88IB76_ARTSF|nr:hypothetical protein QYM36_006742 [Artemia franciscana]
MNIEDIPYGDLKLTRMLQEFLGGNPRTTRYICCSPAAFNEAETKLTLEFDHRVKTVKNAAKVNEELTAEELKRQYEEEKENARKCKEIMKKLEEELLRKKANATQRIRKKNGEKAQDKEKAEKLEDFISDSNPEIEIASRKKQVLGFINQIAI